MKSFRVFIADDHEVICEGFKRILEQCPDLTYAGKANNSLELKQNLPTPVDLVLLDIRMDYSCSIHEIIYFLKKKRIKVAVYSSYFSPVLLEELVLNQDLDGYIVKEGSNQSFIAALREIARGNKYYSASIFPIIMELLDSKNKLQILSLREREVLQLLFLNKEEIAKKLNITLHTVTRHLYEIKRKLKIKENDELLKWAIKFHLTSPFGAKL